MLDIDIALLCYVYYVIFRFLQKCTHSFKQQPIPTQEALHWHQSNSLHVQKPPNPKGGGELIPLLYILPHFLARIVFYFSLAFIFSTLGPVLRQRPNFDNLQNYAS